MRFSVIHPTRGRPQKSLDTMMSWITWSPHQFILSLDYDDPKLNEYLQLYSTWTLCPMPENKGCSLTINSTSRIIIINKNRSAVDAINNGAKVSQGDVMIVVSDDTECMPYWPDKLEQENLSSKYDWILKTQDGIQPWIITMPVMDRAYYNRFGYIYHPDYLHMFCDTELTCVADITGRKIKSNLMFPHKHYSVTKEQPDEVNNKADATWAQGEKLFLERYKRGFDLPVGDPIEDNGMVSWIKRKAR